MINITITISLLITPIILAFVYCLILKGKQSVEIYANYFIVFNITIYMLINTFAYLFNGSFIATFQKWDYSPAILEMGLFYCSLGVLSVISVFKNADFKACLCLFYCIYLIISSFGFFIGDVVYKHILFLFALQLLTALLFYIFYKLLYKKIGG